MRHMSGTSRQITVKGGITIKITISCVSSNVKLDYHSSFFLIMEVQTNNILHVKYYTYLNY